MNIRIIQTKFSIFHKCKAFIDENFMYISKGKAFSWLTEIDIYKENTEKLIFKIKGTLNFGRLLYKIIGGAGNHYEFKLGESIFSRYY
jgi:hypothetical protein